jgi:putative ABC transport system substrate-binding protein
MHSSYRPRRLTAAPLLFGIVMLVLAACGQAQPQAKTYTIGVVNYVPPLNQAFDGFKAKMVELGYVEGKNITYIYHGVLQPDPKAIESEVKNLLDQKIDMFLTMGTPTTLAAKKAVEGTDIPVVFAPVISPVEEGVVQSISHPGGNVTGVQGINNALPKALEWLLKIAPGTKKVYVPYNPADRVSVTTTKPLPEAAAKLGVELLLDEVHTPDEAAAAMQTLPKDAAVLFVITPSLDSGRSVMDKVIIERGIPAGGYTVPDPNLLFIYGNNLAEEGSQAARLVDQIFKGTKPGDLPVETAESVLTINLKAAKAIGLDIPDSILAQAHTVVR